MPVSLANKFPHPQPTHCV